MQDQAPSFFQYTKAKAVWTLVLFVLLVIAEFGFHALFDRSFYSRGGTPPSLLKIPLQGLIVLLGFSTVYSSECSVFCLPKWWAVSFFLIFWLAVCYVLACVLVMRRSSK
jgi:hypothetical protein